MYPLICSLSNAGKFDDFFVVAPYHKLELFYNADYANVNYTTANHPWTGTNNLTSQTRTIDNSSGTAIRYVSSTSTYRGANQVGSLKLYFHGQKIALGNFSS
jgi:hypothetical protein